MAPVLCISPVRLYQHSFLAGTILLLAVVLLCVDFAIIGMRGYAFNTLQRWIVDYSIEGLDGLAYSVLVALVWLVTMFFLLVDLVTALLLPSRDLQEGAVIAFGIISIMQVPIVTLYLKWELSLANSLSLEYACVSTAYSTDCAAWHARMRLVVIASSTIATALHLILIGMCACYVHTRPPTSQDLIANHREKSKQRVSRGDKRDNKKYDGSRIRRFERDLSQLEEKLLRHKSHKSSSGPPTNAGLPTDGWSAGESASLWQPSGASLAPNDPSPHAATAVHTDSDSDLDEKKLLAGEHAA